ncbi:MAG TPA: VCBS domain-containing protein [Thermoanaerobaculia bacterium]|nr:VCBS domain-containing protein [Thermoanaerobaculia bacterium]
MKRYVVALGCAALATFGAYAYADSTIVVKPSDLKPGETKTVTDDGQTITITRDGTSTVISIGREGDHPRAFVIGPRHRKLLVDTLPQWPHAQTWFVCPKDHTLMRVPKDKADQTFQCPVDGTTMEKRKGRGFTFFFDDDLFGTDDL